MTEELHRGFQSANDSTHVILNHSRSNSTNRVTTAG